MVNVELVRDIGELECIKIIERIVHQKTGRELIRDDCFFYNLSLGENLPNIMSPVLVQNTDMLVSTTDVPESMSLNQVGRKAVLMNISDIIVKGVKPLGIMISLGVPSNFEVKELEELVNGIVDTCFKWDIEYIGGDLNETKELIINPTVFGIGNEEKIIHRKGMKEGDNLVANGRFGLTGVGLDILLNSDDTNEKKEKYKRSIKSVLEMDEIGTEALYLAEKGLASASIDSSDGLARSLCELMVSNPGLGFEIDFSKELYDEEALNYSKAFDRSIEELIFGAGEEFIHLFIIPSEKIDDARKVLHSVGGEVLNIGRVISKEKIILKRNGKQNVITIKGFQHFK